MTVRPIAGLALLAALAGCAQPDTSVSVKAVATARPTARPSLPATSLISPGGATAVAPETQTQAGPPVSSNLISNDGGGAVHPETVSAPEGSTGGGWTADKSHLPATAPSASPSPR